MTHKAMWNKFLPLSSELDWCERNYDILPIIAEFWNTISNSIFFIIPPILIYLFKQYSRQVCSAVNVVWILLIIVGLGSVYFHSTLSLVGQLIDEIAISWVCLAAMATWLPNRYLPEYLRCDRKKFQCVVVFLALCSTCLSLIKPEVNHGLLFLYGLPATVLLVVELRRCNCSRVKHIGTMSQIWWVVACLCWVADRFICDVVYIPFLHSAWHVMVCIASYLACVCYAYFYAMYEVPDQCPRLRFWPHDHNSWMGIPYVMLLVNKAKLQKSC